VVVDAGSRDESAERASTGGARVLSLPDRAGPARARNAGVAALNTEVVLFLDADCVPRPDVVDRVREAFSADPALVSLTGSYTAETPAPGFFSQYMNLRHHYTHQCARHEPGTLWTGCGAVRRAAFLAAGGFDEKRFPNGMEDMELGLRMREQGTCRLDPDLQVTHLKRWTLRSAVDADIRRRAVPWSRLVLERGHLPDDLNTRTSQRLAALVAPFALVALPALPLAIASGAAALALASLALLLASLLLNGGLLRLFARERGVSFAARGWLFHQVHLVYAAATLLVCALLWHRPRRAEAGT